MAKKKIVKFTVKCPGCDDESESTISEKDLTAESEDDTRCLTITCGECEQSWKQSYTYDDGVLALGEIIAIADDDEDDEDDEDEENGKDADGDDEEEEEDA